MTNNIQERLKDNVIVNLVDVANITQHDMFAELIMAAAQSIDAFNSRILVYKKLSWAPELIPKMKRYTGISDKDIDRLVQWEPVKPFTPLEILKVDHSLRYIFCPEHQQHKVPSLINKDGDHNLLQSEKTIQQLEKTIYQQEQVINMMKVKLLNITFR